MSTVVAFPSLETRPAFWPIAPNSVRRIIVDDGRSVTLDLHGQDLRQAQDLIQRTVRVAAERGRASVRVIHGSSTSDASTRNPTVKHLLENMLADGRLPEPTGHYSGEESTLISLPVGRPVDRAVMTLRDVL